MPTLYTTEQQVSRPLAGGGQQGGNGSLAAIYRPGSYGPYINVTKDFPWTINQAAKSNAGRVIIKEFEINETTMKRQAAYYLNGYQQFQQGLLPSQGSTPLPRPNYPDQLPNFLEVYRELYPKDRPTGFVYDFPYFDEINFALNTPEWASLDSLEQLGKTTQDVIGTVKNFFTKQLGTPGAAVGETLNIIQGGLELGAAAGQAALGFMYPKVGILDRPRLWQTHSYRDISITIPLYNTLAPEDWKLNRELCELLINQNLYNKRDIITSIPPVFYEVLVIGQHYSWASYVSNITVYNRGNIRLLQKDANNPRTKCNVPDVYEINITLSDLVVPSKNQFQALGNDVVEASIIDPSATLGQMEDPIPNIPFTPGTVPQVPIPSTPTQPPGGCWVAREVYGVNNIKWVIFRSWLYGDTGPKWLQTIYTKFGKRFASWISNKPFIKNFIKYIMDQIIRNYETK